MIAPMIALTVYFSVSLSHPVLEGPRGFASEELRGLITDVLNTAPRAQLRGYCAVELLLLTAATESKMGYYLKQHPTGPARGLFHMEPDTERDIWEHYLNYPRNRDLREWVKQFVGGGPITSTDGFTDLKYNYNYQVAMARIHYNRIKEPLPSCEDPVLLSRYWKKYYNTHKGKGTVAKAETDYQRLVLQLR